MPKQEIDSVGNYRRWRTGRDNVAVRCYELVSFGMESTTHPIRDKINPDTVEMTTVDSPRSAVVASRAYWLCWPLASR